MKNIVELNKRINIIYEKDKIIGFKDLEKDNNTFIINATSYEIKDNVLIFFRREEDKEYISFYNMKNKTFHVVDDNCYNLYKKKSNREEKEEALKIMNNTILIRGRFNNNPNSRFFNIYNLDADKKEMLSNEFNCFPKSVYFYGIVDERFLLVYEPFTILKDIYDNKLNSPIPWKLKENKSVNKLYYTIESNYLNNEEIIPFTLYDTLFNRNMGKFRIIKSGEEENIMDILSCDDNPDIKLIKNLETNHIMMVEIPHINRKEKVKKYLTEQ